MSYRLCHKHFEGEYEQERTEIQQRKQVAKLKKKWAAEAKEAIGVKLDGGVYNLLSFVQLITQNKQTYCRH